MVAHSSDIQLKSTFEKTAEIESVYTNGKIILSQDGSLIYTTCSEDVYILEYASAKKIAALPGDSEIITSFAVAPSQKFLVSASRSLQMKVWDLKTKNVTRSFKGHLAPVIVMDCDESSTLVASGAADSSIKVWDVERGYCTHNFKGHKSVITSLKFKTVGSDIFLASGAEDGSIRIYSLNKNKCEAIFTDHVSVVREIDFTQDGSIAVSGGRDSVLNVWDISAKKLLSTIPVYEAIESIAIYHSSPSPDSKPKSKNHSTNIVYVGGEKGNIRAFDFIKGTELFLNIPKTKSDRILTQLLIAKSHNQLLTVSSDQNIEAYDISNYKDPQKNWQVVGHNDEIIDLSYLGENESHLAVATNSEQLRIYDTKNLRCELIDGHSDILLALDVHNSGTILATGSKDNTVRLWSWFSGEAGEAGSRPTITCIGIASGHTGSVGAVKLSRDPKCAFMVTGGQDRTIKMWDLTNSVDASGEPATLKTKFTVKAHDKDINALAIAPNNKLVASASQDRTIKLWDATDGSLKATLSGHKRGVWAVEFSPVDLVVASSSGDCTIKIWSIQDGSCLKTLEGHTGSPLSIRFLTSGLQLLSCGSEGLIKLWNLKTLECDLTLDKHEDKVWALAVKKDESSFASGASDSTVLFWKDTTQEQMDKLHKMEADNLLMSQALENYMSLKDYRNSVVLALQLDKPHTLVTLFTTTLRSNPLSTLSSSPQKSYLGIPEVDQVIASLSVEQLSKLLAYAREWNTNARLSFVAQAVLRCVFSSYSSEYLLKIPSIRALITSFIPYTERHLSRLDRLLTDSYMLDFALHSLDSYLPPDE